MINTSNFFSKKFPPNYRIHVDESEAVNNIAKHLHHYIQAHSSKELVIVCIGTDRSTGDSLGPLIGMKLQEEPLQHFHVYGTLEDPVHAVNLEEKMQLIAQKHINSFIIGIDACLGRMNSVGHITIGKGPVKPGAAVNKNLPEVGDIHITGIVNIGGMMEYFVLQNTRLHFVMKMATKIASSIRLADTYISSEKEKERKPSLLEAIKPHILIRERKETHL